MKFKLFEDKDIKVVHHFCDNNTGDIYGIDSNGNLILLQKGNGGAGSKANDDEFDYNPDDQNDSPNIGDKLSDDELKELEKNRKDQIAKDREKYGEYGRDETADERAERIKNFGNKLTSSETSKSMKSDVNIIKEREYQKKQESEAEKAARERRAKRSGMEIFKDDIYEFVNNIVSQNGGYEWQRSFDEFNSSYSDSGLLMPGDFIDTTYGQVPYIFVYVDQSGSWDASDREKAQSALATLEEFEHPRDGSAPKLHICTQYFGDDVSEDPEDVGGGTHAGKKLIEDIIKNQAENVVIMTDNDFDKDGYREILGAPKVTVSGAVWFLWKNGQKSNRLFNRLDSAQRIVSEYNI